MLLGAAGPPRAVLKVVAGPARRNAADPTTRVLARRNDRVS